MKLTKEEAKSELFDLITSGQVTKKNIALKMGIDALSNTGRWIHWTDDICDYARCSKCDYGDEGEVKLGEESNFCPKCGSDNREVSE